MRPFDNIVALEQAQILDRPAAVARGVVQRLLRRPAIKDALHGVWLGHPLHPALAQLTLGSFLSAALIDLVGAGRRESTGLITLGVAATVPTVAAGWADFADSHEEQQRVGLVHAATNTVAVTCFLAVLARRARGGDGRALSVTAGAISGLAAVLGGHLSYRQALGANHAEDIPHIGPGDWQTLGPAADLPDGHPVRRHAGDTPVLVLRRGDVVSVLSDRCPHLSAPMHEGEIDEDHGVPTVVCPWHGSEFRIPDGTVVHGPATAPLPCFESRVIAGNLQARVRTIPGVPAS